MKKSDRIDQAADYIMKKIPASNVGGRMVLAAFAARKYQ